MYSDNYIFSISCFVAKNYGEPVPIEERDVFSSIEKVLNCEGGIQIRWSKSLTKSTQGQIQEGEFVEILCVDQDDITPFIADDELLPASIVYRGILTPDGKVNTFLYDPGLNSWTARINKIGEEIKGQ